MVPMALISQVQPRTGHEGKVGKKRYSSTLSLTSALDGSGRLRPLYPGEREPIAIV